MVSIKVRPGEPIERVLRIFKRLVNREGIIKAARAHRFYTKPSEKKRLKSSRKQRSRRTRSLGQQHYLPASF